MILLAVSGGIDSMCMAEKARRQGGPFAIAHCNFALRGAESDADEALVRQWAERSGIPLHVRRFETASYAAEKGISIEMAARELRYRWFGQLCREQGYEAVAVAHNADDNAETLLLNLLRGTGVKGLYGMRSEGFLPVPEFSDIPLRRPLLGLSRAEIEAYVSAHHVPYRTDRTNAENEFRRNKLRNEVFPVFREINPSYLDALDRDRRHIGEVAAIAEDYYRRQVDAVWDGTSADLAVLDALDFPDYVLYRLLDGEGFAPYSIAKVKEIFHSEGTRSGRKVIEGDREIVFTGGRILVRPYSHTAAESDVVIVRGPGRYRIGPVSLEISVHARSEFSSFKTPEGETLADAAALPFPFIVRPWRNGDRLRPLGLGGVKKLSDLFTDLHLSAPRKERTLVALRPGLQQKDGPDYVSAVLGFRIDETVQVTPATENVLRMVIERQ